MGEQPSWNYFNGQMHGWNDKDGYHPPVPMTLAYCAACAPAHIPGWNKNRKGSEHWDTGFRSAPWRIGRPCDGCGKEV